MAVHDGFASRSCFCLWSTGDNVTRAIEDNHKTYLHSLWQTEHFYVEVPDQEGEKKFSIGRVVWSLMSYPAGMIGYLADTAVKVVLLIGNLMIFLVSLASCNRSWRDARGIILLDTLTAVGIGAIGILAPPLAYRLDAKARETMSSWANSQLHLS